VVFWQQVSLADRIAFARLTMGRFRPNRRWLQFRLQCLGKLTNLEVLDLTGSSITDAGLEHLRGLTNLRDLYRQGHDELTQQVKAPLLEVLAEPVRLGGETGPLMVNLHRLVASLLRCFRGEDQRLEIPEACT
jgi:hypothetical protein